MRSRIRNSLFFGLTFLNCVDLARAQIRREHLKSIMRVNVRTEGGLKTGSIVEIPREYAVIENGRVNYPKTIDNWRRRGGVSPDLSDAEPTSETDREFLYPVTVKHPVPGSKVPEGATGEKPTYIQLKNVAPANAENALMVLKDSKLYRPPAEVIKAKAEALNAIVSPSEPDASSDETHGGSNGSVRFEPLPRAPSRRNLSGAGLNAVVAHTATDSPKRVEVYFPPDRCQAGMMKFGSLKCPVLGRGVRASGGFAPYLVRGKDSQGRACRYLPVDVRNGATPVGDYNLQVLLSTSKFKQGRWGPYLPTAMVKRPPPPLAKRGPNTGVRGDLFIHSDRAPGMNLERGRDTYGCIKIDPSCQKELNEYFRGQPRGTKFTMTVKEVPTGFDYDSL